MTKCWIKYGNLVYDKDWNIFINEYMRLNCKHFCLLMHKVDYDILLLESKLCKRCKRRAFCIDPIIAI